MGTAYPTASEQELVETCLAAAVLPRADQQSASAGYGTLGHLFLQRVRELGGPAGGGVEKALATFEPDQRELLEAIQLDGLPLDPAALAAEVAFAWDPRTDTARELGRGMGRDYSAAVDEEDVGTVDLVGLLDDDGVFVGDWKFLYGHVAPARRHRQLRRNALAAARAYGRSRAVVEIIRPREGSPPWRDRAAFDAWDLAEIADEQRRFRARVDAARAPGAYVGMVVGTHCTRCKSFRFCPAQHELANGAGGLIRQQIPNLTELLGAKNKAKQWQNQITAMTAELGRELSFDSAADAYELGKVLKFLGESLVSTARDFAALNPFRLRDGRMYGPRERREESINAEVAYSVVERRYGAEVAQKVCKRVYVDAELERAAKAEADAATRAAEDAAAASGKKAKRTTIKSVVDAIKTDIAARDGLRTYKVDAVREYRAAGGDDE